jgi:hypothetical protein
MPWFRMARVWSFDLRELESAPSCYACLIKACPGAALQKRQEIARFCRPKLEFVPCFLRREAGPLGKRPGFSYYFPFLNGLDF